MNAAVQPIRAQSVPSESQLAVAYSVCRSITRTAAKNFYYAFLLLPGPKRRALYAIYAFMRRCDDIADDVRIPARERRAKLGSWIESFHCAHAGQPSDEPVLLALSDTLHRHQIPTVLLDQLTYGTAMDIEDQARDATAPSAGAAAGAPIPPTVYYKNFDELYLYCYRVASVVGLVCIRIFGYRDTAAEPLAERCGLAFQLTNILRDVKEDAAMGRVYFPLEDLVSFDIAPSELRAGKDLERLRPLLAKHALRAREYYKAAEELLPLIDEDSQPALWVLVAIYQRLLDKIVDRQFDVFGGRIQVSLREKLVILGKGFLKRLS